LIQDENVTTDIATTEGFDESVVSELFHENSKQRRSDRRVAERIMAMVRNPILMRIADARKRYPSAPKISLPDDFPPARTSFDAVILQRRSSRGFNGGAIDFCEAARLLHFANGVTGGAETYDGRTQHFRAAPSGGALYPVEVYFIALSVNALGPGIYHYDPVSNLLEFIHRGSVAAALSTLSFTPELAQAAAVVALTGIPLKSRIKYGERGYRFMLLEAGHIAQNILLTASSLGLGTVPIGGFIDDELDRLLMIDGLDEMSLYLVAVGQNA
jgi:SagB-type dehydrogenase family enzyme